MTVIRHVIKSHRESAKISTTSHHKDKQAVSRRRYLLTVFGSIMYRYVLHQSESVPAVLMV